MSSGPGASAAAASVALRGCAVRPELCSLLPGFCGAVLQASCSAQPGASPKLKPAETATLRAGRAGSAELASRKAPVLNYTTCPGPQVRGGQGQAPGAAGAAQGAAGAPGQAPLAGRDHAAAGAEAQGGRAAGGGAGVNGEGVRVQGERHFTWNWCRALLVGKGGGGCNRLELFGACRGCRMLRAATSRGLSGGGRNESSS